MAQLAQSKREFFRKGVNEQKTPDIVIDLKRVDIKAIDGWTDEQKKQAFDFCIESRRTFKAFMEAIESSLLTESK